MANEKESALIAKFETMINTADEADEMDIPAAPAVLYRLEFRPD